MNTNEGNYQNYNQNRRNEREESSEEEEEDDLPKENKTLKVLQEEFYAKDKIINESPKVNLINH